MYNVPVPSAWEPVVSNTKNEMKNKEGDTEVKAFFWFLDNDGHQNRPDRRIRSQLATYQSNQEVKLDWFELTQQVMIRVPLSCLPTRWETKFSDSGP